MTVTKDIVGIVPGVMSVGLLAENVKSLKSMGKMKNSKISTSPKKMVKLGVKNMVGIGLIGATASMANKIQ